MSAVFRTPDERFEGLPGYDYGARYVQVDGGRCWERPSVQLGE